ncbi:hypothetical protein [Actinoplanes sp. NPDC051851]|uniref:hypothetical protein n=1 Tax=Actinoplanes sp. NPDC051851 TaxID=3154753 RepID=UPI00342B5593
MSRRKRPPPEPGSDRYLCPAPVCGLFAVKRHVLAAALREQGRTAPVTLAEARRWRDDPESAPPEGIAVLAAAAAEKACRLYADLQREFDEEYRSVVLTERVKRRLLAGARRFRRVQDIVIAKDMAWQAAVELAHSCPGECGDPDLSALLPIDHAALRWAGVDPLRHETWPLHLADCPHAAD